MSGVTVEIKRKATAVEGVDVVANWCPKPDPIRHPASAPPRVVSTYPADGAAVAPGALMLRITFDQPMTCSWAVDYQSKGDEPCRPDGMWSLPDRRTWQVRCNIRGNADYRVRFGEDDGVHFMGQSGREASVYDLSFSSTDARPFRSVEERALTDPLARRTDIAAGYIVCHDDSTSEHARCIHLSASHSEVRSDADR